LRDNSKLFACVAGHVITIGGMRSRSLLFALLFLAVACSRTESPAPARTGTASPAKLRIGLLTPGSINDGGWNAIAYEGLKRAEKELSAEISHQETRTPAEFEEGFRYFGSREFDLAFGHGFEFQDPAMAAGKLYPKTIFITTSGSSVAANVSPMVFELEQATYLLGMTAALESKSGKAAVIGGIKLPSIDSTFLAFKAGARAVRPDFEIQEIYTGNFDDLGAARLAALSVIDNGADFIFHQANEAGRGVFQACTERKVTCFGSNKNQNALAPDVILASAVLDVPSAFLSMARTVSEGKFKPGVQRFGMKEGIVSLAWNEPLRARLSAATIERLTQEEAKIRSGALQVPRGNF
jgi:basic membrane protein A